jgi:hypothetical protein
MSDDDKVVGAVDVKSVIDTVQKYVNLAMQYAPQVIAVLEFLKHFSLSTAADGPHALAGELHRVADQIQTNSTAGSGGPDVVNE